MAHTTLFSSYLMSSMFAEAGKSARTAGLLETGSVPVKPENMILFFALCTPAFSPSKHSSASSSHVLISHPSDPHQRPLQEQLSFDETGGGGRSPPGKEQTMKEALHEAGLTRVIYDEEGIIPDDGDDYYYDFDTNNDYIHPQKEMEKLEADKKSFGFPKKYQRMREDLSFTVDEGTKHNYESDGVLHPGGVTDPFHDWAIRRDEELLEATADPSMMSLNEHGGKERIKKKDPVVLPVTTEGKTGSKQKTEDPLKVYGFPKELLPIMPGGGSRFEDVEREKLEKKKMSQTKGSDDDSVDNGGSHEAESLYSSASLSSLSLCFYWLMSFHRLDRILLL